jgi:hypothetical protein
MFSSVGYNQLQNVVDLPSTISQHRHLVELEAENRLPTIGKNIITIKNDARATIMVFHIKS